MTLYIDKYFSIYKSMKIGFLTVLISFNLLYVVCKYMENGWLKISLFFVLMIVIGNGDIVVNNLCSGLSSRFSEKEMSLNFLGKAVSGLFSNVIMLIDLLISNSDDNSKIYIIFLIIGNSCFIAFFCLQEKFFALCKSNYYHMKRRNSLSFVLDDEDEIAPLQTDEKEKTKSMEDVDSEDEDMNKNYNKHTMTLTENFKQNADNYIGLFFVFASTLAVFPVLMFKLDFYLPNHIQYAYITFIFNLSDTFSRYIYANFKLKTVYQVHFFVLIKIALIYVNYISIGRVEGFLSTHWFRFIIVFSQGFLNGYLCMLYVAFTAVKFDSIYDKNRAGYLISFSIQVGLTAGALLSLIWK